MAVFTNQKKGTAAAHSVGNGDRLIPFHHIIDLAEVQADNPTFASGDGIDIIDIPADSALLFLDAEIGTAVTSDGTSEEVEIGDSDDDDRFVAAATTLTAGTVLTQAITTAPLYRYSAANKLRLKFSATTSVANMAGTIIITGVLVDCSAKTPTTTISPIDN